MRRRAYIAAQSVDTTTTVPARTGKSKPPVSGKKSAKKKPYGKNKKKWRTKKSIHDAVVCLEKEISRVYGRGGHLPLHWDLSEDEAPSGTVAAVSSQRHRFASIRFQGAARL